MKLTYSLLLVNCLIWLGPYEPVQAQQATLSGFVKDAVSEQAMQGASVSIRISERLVNGTTTDGDGYFVIRRIPTGTYTLRISFVGYATHEETISFDSPADFSRNVILVPSEEELDEVVVQADAEAGVTAVNAGLESIVPADIERVPMPGVTGDLASYLQTVPGITLQGDRGGQFFVRGGALDQNLALLDGMPVYMPFHVLSFYSAFPEEILDNAQVYTGGFGARYGSRISSIIDVKTRNGNKQNLAGSVSVAPFLSSARIEGPLVKNRVSFIGSARHSLIEDIMPTMLGQDLPYRFGDLFGKFHALINTSHSLSITAMHTYDRGDIAGTRKTFEGEALTSAPIDSNEVAWNNTVIGGKYTYLSENLPLLFELHGNRSEMTNEMGPRDRRERSSSITSYDVAGDLTFSLDRLVVRGGISYRESTMAYELGGQFQGIPEIAENTLKEVNAYTTANLSFLEDQLQIEPGVHLYSLPQDNRQWLDPRIRLNYSPHSATQFNAAWGIYHQATVGLNDERDIGNLFTAWTTVPSGSPTPSSQHVIAGLNVQVQPWLSVAAEGFLKSFDNLSVPVFSVLPSFTTSLQPAEGMTRGLDLRLSLQNRPFWYGSVLDGTISYALSEVEYDAAQVTYHPAHDRRHQVNALIHAEKDNTGITIQLQYGSGLPFTQSSGFDMWLLLTPDTDVSTAPGQERIVYAPPFEGRQPAYQRVDAWIERRVEHGRVVMTLRAGAVNIFNRDNLFYFDLLTFQRVDQLPFVPSVGLKIELR